MIRRIGRKRYSIWAFDVESHNDDESIAKRETSVWLYSFINEESKIDDEKSYGYNLDTWLKDLEEKTTTTRTKGKRDPNNLRVYIWNESFEWAFILPVLLSHGFKWKLDITKEDAYVFNSITNKTASSVWSVKLKFKKSGGIVELIDLCKIFPGSLRSVAKSFKLETQKGEIDYKLNRLHGHIVTTEEKHYCFKDTRIIMDMLVLMDKRDDKDFFKSISAAGYSCKKWLKVGWPHAWKPLKQFRKMYPELDDVENDFLRKTLAGGITYAPSRYQFKDIKQRIVHLDAHSMHPTQLATKLFGYGKGTYFKGKPNFPYPNICAVHIKVSYSGVKLHSIIKLIGTEIAEGVELWLWDFEIFTMLKCYEDLRIEYLDGYCYHIRHLPWRGFFVDCYAKRKQAKKIGDAFNVQQMKRLINAGGYGKLVEKRHEIDYENIVDDEGLIDSVIHDKAKDKIKLRATYEALQVGSMVPAYSRVCLIEHALTLGYENIVYFDTDSIFAIDSPEVEQRIKDNFDLTDHLGGWSREKDIERGQFTAPKRYKIEEVQDDGSTELVVHAAGINNLEAPSYEDLDLVNGKYDIQGKLRCKGGTLIIFKPKEMKVQSKYKAIYEANRGQTQ